jgi:hypothetical protein
VNGSSSHRPLGLRPASIAPADVDPTAAAYSDGVGVVAGAAAAGDATAAAAAAAAPATTAAAEEVRVATDAVDPVTVFLKYVHPALLSSEEAQLHYRPYVSQYGSRFNFEADIPDSARSANGADKTPPAVTPQTLPSLPAKLLLWHVVHKTHFGPTPNGKPQLLVNTVSICPFSVAFGASQLHVYFRLLAS